MPIIHVVSVLIRAVVNC